MVQDLRLRDIDHQLIRYGEVNPIILDALEIITDINDDFENGRHHKLINNNIYKLVDKLNELIQYIHLYNLILDNMAYMLYLESWLKDEEHISDLDETTLDSLREKWEKYFNNPNNIHDGDCTDQIYACSKCIYEDFIKLAKNLINK